jgi:hypothetical protein
MTETLAPSSTVSGPDAHQSTHTPSLAASPAGAAMDPANDSASTTARSTIEAESDPAANLDPSTVPPGNDAADAAETPVPNGQTTSVSSPSTANEAGDTTAAPPAGETSSAGDPNADVGGIGSNEQATPPPSQNEAGGDDTTAGDSAGATAPSTRWRSHEPRLQPPPWRGRRRQSLWKHSMAPTIALRCTGRWVRPAVGICYARGTLNSCCAMAYRSMLPSSTGLTRNGWGGATHSRGWRCALGRRGSMSIGRSTALSHLPAGRFFAAQAHCGGRTSAADWCA